MKAVRFAAIGKLQAVVLPRPQPARGQVLLRVVVAGICHTDVHIVAGDFPVQPPRVLGHELVGEVVDVGPEVDPDLVGASFGVQPATYCGTCLPCLTGFKEQCLNFRCLGNTEDGGWAEYALARTDQLIPLGELSARSAVWLEPVACIVHALSKIDSACGKRALVVGAGPMGLLATQALAAAGARRVAVVDLNPGKLKLAQAVGAGLTVRVPRTGPTPEADGLIHDFAPLGVDVVVETSGKPVALHRAVRWAGPGGNVVLFGVSSPDDRLSDVSPAEIFTKELKLVGTSGSTPEAFAGALRLLGTGAVRPDELVMQVVGLDGIPEAVEMLAKPGEKGKVLVDPSR